jgi:hypothetical protein
MLVYLDFRSGFANVFFQKLATDPIRVTLVGPWDNVESKRYNEGMYGCNRGYPIHFCAYYSEAEKWLGRLTRVPVVR